MSQENVATVRRIYEFAADEWSRGGGPTAWDRSELAALWDPEVVIDENVAFPDAATYRGYDGLARWWAAFFEVYDELRLEPQEFLPAGNRVVVPVRHWLLSKAGVGLEREITHVWTLRNGRVIHVTGHHERSQALEDVGLSE
jgi:ketosteroid isomerase-like protein